MIMVEQREIAYRKATIEDVPEIMHSRSVDAEWGPADHRTAAYLEGTHHPQQALAPRILYVAMETESVVGYVGGHLTQRYDCDGELQYLWVAREHRCRGIASRLFELLVLWFKDKGAARICVDVLPENSVARSFYKRFGAVELNTHWLVWEDIGNLAFS